MLSSDPNSSIAAAAFSSPAANCGSPAASTRASTERSASTRSQASWKRSSPKRSSRPWIKAGGTTLSRRTARTLTTIRATKATLRKRKMTAQGRPERMAQPSQQILLSHVYFTPLAQRLFLYFSAMTARISLHGPASCPR